MAPSLLIPKYLTTVGCLTIKPNFELTAKGP